MKDGYYLATYISASKIGNLYKLTVKRHDQNISLWKKSGDKIELVHFWELERQSRLKHHDVAFYDVEQAKNQINKLLFRYKLTLDDMEDIWGAPFLKTSVDYVNDTDYTYHSLCHIFSSIMLDSNIFYNDNIIALAVDARADYETENFDMDTLEYTGCVVRNGEIELFNIESPAALWSISANKYGLGEGSLMALASASKTQLINKKINMEFTMMKSIDRYRSNKRVFLDAFNEVIDLDEINCFEKVNVLDENFSFDDNMTSAVMKEIQETSKQIMVRQIDSIIRRFHIDTKDTYLCLSGGYGLNCPTNSYLMNKYKFKGFMAPPCINDSGQSLGIALYMFYRNMDRVNFKLRHCYYGDSFSDEDIIIDEMDKWGFIKSVSKIDFDVIVRDIIDDPIVWFDGSAEIGPRALGHRSLLGDSRFIETKNKLNAIKLRQEWRPVAPIVIEEELDEWFEDAYQSPFMLHTFKIREDKLCLLKSISHLDNSARVQTISKNIEEQKLLYSVIKHFGKMTGIPILCNTSLNDRDEPIINRPSEALHFALIKNIKIVYINGKRIEMKNHTQYHNEAIREPLLRLKMHKEEELKKQINPFDLSKDILGYYYYLTDLQKQYDITNKHDARMVKRIVEKMKTVDERQDLYLGE